MEFVEAPGFTAFVSDYLDDDEYRRLQVFLAGKPDPAIDAELAQRAARRSRRRK